MVEFAPEFTQVVYLDTEWYVPKVDRAERTGSLVVNPARDGHRLLGGVFVRDFPLQDRRLPAEEIWAFGEGEENRALREVVRLFQRAWAEMNGRGSHHPDLVVVGIGVARFDLPALFTRCVVERVDTLDRLYETFFNTKIVDLADVGIRRGEPGDPILYPRTANQLLNGRLTRQTKSSGKRVWQLFDEGRLEEIQARTRSEVEDIIELAREFRVGRSAPEVGSSRSG